MHVKRTNSFTILASFTALVIVFSMHTSANAQSDQFQSHYSDQYGNQQGQRQSNAGNNQIFSGSEQFSQVQSMMGPMMEDVMSSMFDGLLTMVEKPETAERMATFTKNYYDALRKRGFTEVEALQIVTSASPMSMMSMK